MATYDKTLSQPPTRDRELELWLQHAAGMILFEDVRNYAVGQLDGSLSAEAKAAALKAIDDTLYGLMMVMDGVTGSLENAEHRVTLSASVQLTDLTTEQTTRQIQLIDGDGMCMGYHGWREGDFGEHPVVNE